MDASRDEQEPQGEELYEAIRWLQEHVGFPEERVPVDRDDEDEPTLE